MLLMMTVVLSQGQARGKTPLQAGQEASSKAREVVAAAIEAMGGKAYLKVENSTSEGRYFVFQKGRKGFAKFFDWTVYSDPVKSRFQSGKGKRQIVTVHNMELEKGWRLEGVHDVEPLKPEEIEDFRRVVKRDLDYLLRNRLDEDGLQLFYYGQDEVSGSGNWEAVEFLDTANDSVVVFFDRDTHLPAKVETHVTNKMGVRLKQEKEFYNWHWIDGVFAPLRIDILVDGELSQQQFLEKLAFNTEIPPDYFLEPQAKPRKNKK